MVGSRKRSLRGALGVVVAGGAIGAAALVSPADAAPVTFPNVNCAAVVTLAGGGTLNQAQAVDVTVEVAAPATAEAGSPFTVSLPGGSTDLPTSALNGALAIVEYSNLSTTYQVDGATIVPGSLASAGSPTLDGVPITGNAEIVGTNKVKISTPGPIPPGTLTRPTVTFEVLAGAEGDVVDVKAVELTTGTKLTAGGAPFGDAAVTCDVPQTVLATTTVVAPLPPPPPPAPPGAPTAANDLAETAVGTAVTIDVLANDTPADENTPIDTSSLKVKAAPKNGTVAVADGKVVYTPDAGFVGRDIFQYEICSAPPPATTTTTEGEQLAASAVVLPEDDGPKCHFANVTVDVKAPATTTVTAATTPTTAGTAPTTAAAELPRTGAPSAPLAALGLALALVGGAALALVAPRPARARRAR